MHVKHVSDVTFYHLSNICLLNVLKINEKINTVQNTNILLFVRSRSLTISNRSLLTLQLTSEDSVSRHVSVQMVYILNITVNKLLQTSSFFHVFLVQLASIHRVSF